MGFFKKKITKKTVELVASGTRIQTGKNVILSFEHISRKRKKKMRRAAYISIDLKDT